MTSNIGTEYINLKQAQYNRVIKKSRSAQPMAYGADKGASDALSARPHKSVSPRAGRPTYDAARTQGNQRLCTAGNASFAGSVSIPANDDYTAKDLVGDLAGELGRAVAKRRKAAAGERAKMPIYMKKYVAAATPVPLSMLGYMVIFAVIAMFLVLGNSRINEATLRADSLKSSINGEMSRAEKLNSALTARNDIAYIEDYAENVLGMVKSTDVAKRYVSISGEDKIVVNGSPVATQAEN